MITRLLLCALLLTAPVERAGAETVFIPLPFAEKGNGWVFGSREDRSCWIAFPWHLVEREGDVKGMDFVDQSGRSGETASPVRAIDVAGVESGTGLDDLAFARIISGRRTGECTSRLGLPSGEAYVQALRSDSPLELTAVQENSFYTMIVEHTRAVTDSARGSVL